MQDHELVERPGKGWSPWKEGAGLANIEAVWWDARVLFAKLNSHVRSQDPNSSA
ncbi:hypothetical protein [Mesorhizobium humile]|uniref:Uncharacterized protein n=1 Tax=Mesorhizobium humile TaxID=3072313 RepID=A0ABU4YM28_9HYPH|nr:MULTISPECIES: hypothetical protein [unclassified Mesorhizobium]MDX8457904.1 hypothetical protein [Mesorhizobium sp. VK2D]MDX8487984.1 hypothetical protein [Mesorhizobium sp. VK2B]